MFTNIFKGKRSKETMDTDSKSLSTAICNFSARFCNELPKDKNVVCSPLSAELVLALLTLGSTDPARQQLLDSLGLADDDSTRSSFSSVTSKLKSITDVTLNIANKVFIKEGSYELQPQLKDDAIKIFNAAMEKADFDDGEAVANKINTWVETETNNKIKDLVSKDTLDGDTRLVLINAIYFKGKWDNPFKRDLTKEHTFHLNANTTVQVPTMCKEDDFLYRYSQHLQAQIVEIPFVRNEASMLMVLPNEIEGLNGVLAKLAAGYDLMSDIKEMYKTEVYVLIPKFKIETEIDLKELLPKLGVSAIFERNNSGLNKLLNNDEALYVSTAVQKAFIEVNEEGAEAAAATYMGAVPCCMPPVFEANHPYLYLLLGPDRTPLFIGVYRGVD